MIENVVINVINILNILNILSILNIFMALWEKKNFHQELRTEADLEMIGNKRAKEVNSKISGVWEVHSSLTEQFWLVRNNQNVRLPLKKTENWWKHDFSKFFRCDHSAISIGSLQRRDMWYGGDFCVCEDMEYEEMGV